VRWFVSETAFAFLVELGFEGRFNVVDPRWQFVVGPDNFDDVESSPTELDVIPFGECRGGSTYSESFVAVNRVGWTLVDIATASLHLDVDHRTPIDRDDVELAQAVADTLSDDGHSSATKELGRDAFASSSQRLAWSSTTEWRTC